PAGPSAPARRDASAGRGWGAGCHSWFRSWVAAIRWAVADACSIALDLHAEPGDEVAPLCDVACGALGERLGRAALRKDSLHGPGSLALGQHDHRGDLAVEPRRDRRRQVLRPDPREPQRGLEALEPGLIEGRHVGQIVEPLLARDRERAQLAGADELQRGRQKAELQVDAALV